MTDLTPLDSAHHAMEAAPNDDAARMRFYERLADCELFVLLAREAVGDKIEPEVFELSDDSFVLVFDREERLAAFVGRVAPYAAMSGRALVSMLAENAGGAGAQNIGLGVNLEVAPSSILIPPGAVNWLAQTLREGPEHVEETAQEFRAPIGLPEAFLIALDAKLALGAGMAHSAYLVGVVYENGGSGHLLGIVDAVDGAQGALAKAVNEALVFSGIEAGAVDVGFFAASDPVTAQLARVGLRFDLPEVMKNQEVIREAPGSNPEKPPILR